MDLLLDAKKTESETEKLFNYTFTLWFFSVQIGRLDGQKELGSVLKQSIARLDLKTYSSLVRGLYSFLKILWYVILV